MSAADTESLNRRSVRTGSSSPLPSVSLSRDHIIEALRKSKDGGATLDLAHKGLTDVGEDGAEELANVGQEAETGGDSTVVRIALAHNRLTTLPMAFALLSRLQYLVLKYNNFTVFPDVLTILPSLEILDLSYNKIKRLPSQPGSLQKLQVFSLAHNRIHRLPPYFSKFRELHLFKVDRNPLEWPPKDVMSPPSQPDDHEAMKGWIKSVQQWMESNDQHTGERKQSDDSIQSTAFQLESDHNSLQTSGQGGKFRMPSTALPDDAISTHVRSISMESQSSKYSDDASQTYAATSFTAKSPRPPRLRLDNLSPSSSSDVGRSPDSYLPTPAESISSNEDSTIQSSGSRQHGRNASYAGGGPMSRFHLSKKSLPDMRSAKLILRSAPPLTGPSRAAGDHFVMPSPPHRQESDPGNGSFGQFQPNILRQNDIMSSPVALERPAPPMDVERNSYFRRLSTLKPATLAKTIPAALLALVDAVRGILFGVSQIYQTLQHYTVYAIDERLSAVLLKVLDPASAYMVQLINALDRFDTLSKRTLPPPSVCRAVVESCRDNVTVFGKAVGVLSLQLKVLATHDDVRYTRQMLIVLYGAMAEISSAWQNIAGRIEEVKPLLRDHRPPPASKYPHAPTLRATMPFSADISVVSPTTPAATSPTPHLPTHPIPRSLARPVSPHSAADGRTRMSRRHAGSFSYKDVELGKLLPSNTDAPQLSIGILGSASQTSILRIARRPAALGSSGSGGPISQDGTIRPSTSVTRLDTHSRQGSTNSFMASGYSPSLVLRAPLDVLSNTSTLVDKEALEAMKVAVQAAPSVWAMTDDMLQDNPDLKEELSEMLARAKDITDKLRNDIRAVENGDAAADRKCLRSDAHVFANTVIQLFNVIKTHSSAHSMSSTLRISMVKLTNATEEYIMLLHVSSFSPTPRPYSPMVSPLAPPSATEDGRLGANLSRSRSFVPTSSSKLTPPIREPPRSALPNQSFKLTTPPRFTSVRNYDE